MIRVRKLRLQVPRHLRHEAEAVARLAAEQLAQQTSRQTGGTVGRLAVGPLPAAKGISRHRLAGDIARAVSGALAARRGQGG